MIKRTFWLEMVQAAWKRKSVVWLAGVRRSGKTFLCRSLPDVEFLDCELPRVRRMLEDPETFWESRAGRRVVLDEIHRLADPSQVLKIAADHFPSVRVLATGSSTLAATAKFRDTLTGRKAVVWLTPMTIKDGADFGQTDLPHRLLRGGLPPHFMAGDWPEREYQEWMDAYWARDIQELFRLEKRAVFMKFTDMLLTSSGGIFEATRFARACEANRGTITNYLATLETTFAAHVLRPYHGRKAEEIIHAPKVFMFDTGFVCAFRGWTTLRPEDVGGLWEHLVLNEMHARWQMREVRYWRDKRGNEVDFILAPRGRPPIAIECKSRPEAFEPAAMARFRVLHPGGKNYVICPHLKAAYIKRYKDLEVEFLPLEALFARVGNPL